MESISDTTARIVDLEARQDAALRELEALEKRVEQVLNEQIAALARLSASAAPQFERAA